jgi:hypothetical protein
LGLSNSHKIGFDSFPIYLFLKLTSFISFRFFSFFCYPDFNFMIKLLQEKIWRSAENKKYDKRKNYIICGINEHEV